MSPITRTGVRPVSVVAMAILSLSLSLVAAGPVLAQDDATPSPSPGLTIDPGVPGEPGGPDTPVEEPSLCEVPLPCEDGATAVVPEDGLKDIVDTAWDHVVVAPDGRTLTVYFWSGADSCYGLAGVTVDLKGSVPTITLQTGTRPGVDVCIAIAVLYSTQVVLDQPVLGGGVR